MEKTHNDCLRRQRNCGGNTNGGKRKRKADLAGLQGKLEFIRLARKEIARLDDQYLDLKSECKSLNRQILNLGNRIMAIIAGGKGKRPASEMVIRLKGVRREQFQAALRYKSLHPTRSMYKIAQAVFEPPTLKDGDRGYPTVRSLYRYMAEMNRKFECFK